MFYQALAGAWPSDLTLEEAAGVGTLARRLSQFMLKAVREAKVFTSWTAQNEPYEAAIESFTRDALDLAKSGAFLQDFLETCEPLFLAGALNALSQTAIKLTAPGITDIYQGAELWDLSLVDPDNRRPIDFAAYQALQTATAETEMSDLLGSWRSGAIKLRLIEAGLALRQSAKDLFAKGAYMPLAVEGTAAEHVVAFARVHEGNAGITIVPRACLDFLRGERIPLVPSQSWGDTLVRLPQPLAGWRWRNLVTNQLLDATRGLALGEVLQHVPVALLVCDSLK
jgi:(1->4)-alpha-D-glucan 1-alpha-D-glucosylmutase